MRHTRITALLWALAVGAYVSAAYAEEIDPDTRDKLNTIIAGWRANQAMVKDLQITGSLQLVAKQPSGESREQRTTTFKYLQAGENRRVDYSHTPDSDGGSLVKQHEARWACDGTRSLNYIADTGLASVHEAVAFHFQSPLTLLHTYLKTRAWTNHIEHIEYVLSHWHADRETMTISTVVEEDRSLLKVVRESNGTARYRTEWQFDPSRGFNVVALKHEEFFPDGALYDRFDMTWEVREAAPGIWVVAGCNSKEERREDIGYIAISQTIQAEEVSVNTGKVAPSLFSLEGLKVPVGMTVADYTFDPPLNYGFRSPPLSETELDLTMQMANTNPPVETNSPANTDADNHRKRNGITPEEPTPMPDDTKRELVLLSVPRMRILVWAVAVAAVAAITGYLLVRRKESKS